MQTIIPMPDNQAAAVRKAVFVPGAMVLVTLSAPREKFWGVLLEVSPAGISLRGLDLNSFEDFVHLVRSGEAASPAAVFFPMHRVERMELDLPDGNIPSLSERFTAKTGLNPAALATATGASSGSKLEQA